MSEFFEMGGYAAYVWTAYGITLLVLVFSAWSARNKRVAALTRVHDSATDRDPPRKQPTVRRLQ